MMDNPPFPPVPSRPSMPPSPIQPSMKRVIPLLSGSVFLSVFHSRFLVVALEKDISLEEARWGLLTFWIASGVLFVPMGWLADTVGRKRVFLLGMAVFPAGLIVEAVASDWKMLIVAGLISSVGNAAAIPVGMAILLAAVPAQRRSTAVGGYYTMFGVVTIVSSFVIAWVDEINWNWMIPIYVLIGATTIGFGKDQLVEVTGEGSHETSVDVGVLSSPPEGDVPPVVPNVRKLWTRNMVLSNCAGLAWVSAIGFISFAVSVYLINSWAKGLNTERAVFILAAVVIGLLALPLVVGRFADKWGHRLPMLVVAIYLLMFSLASVSLADGRTMPSILWFGNTAAFFLNVGIASTIFEGAAVNSLPIERLGIGVAIHRFFRYLGTIISTWTSLFVIWAVGSPLEEQRWLFGLGALCVVGAIALASGIDTRPGVHPPADTKGTAAIE